MNSDGSGSSGETVTAKLMATIITAMRTLTRARVTTPSQKTSFFRTASFSRANTTWFAAQPTKTKTATMIAITAHSGNHWNSRQMR